MKLTIGLVGLPNAGKSSLFQALTGQAILIAEYPFATIEPNIGSIAIADHRLAVLAKLYNSRRTIAADLTFIDIAGLIRGAHQGEGLGNKFLSHIASTNLIVQVIDCFKSKQPAEDIKVIATELLLADWSLLDKQIDKLKKPAKSDPQTKELLTVMQAALAEINQSIWLQQSPQAKLYTEKLKHLNLLSLKPRLYVFNLKASDLSQPALLNDLKTLSGSNPSVCLSAPLENELNQLDAPQKAQFLQAYNLAKSGLDQLTKTCLKTLKLQTFLTAGQSEVRAWLVSQDSLAQKAAGVIHSDLEKGFIAAEIVDFNDLQKLKSWSAAKAAGRCRIEGKNYQLRPNDVINFRFNL